MTSQLLFPTKKRDGGTSLDPATHELLGPLIEEFVTTPSLERAEWTFERIARGLPCVGWHMEPIDRLGAGLHEIMEARRRRTKNEPFGLEMKGLRWLELGYGDTRTDVEGWIAEQRASLDAAPARSAMAMPFSWADPATLPRRAWLYGRHLIRGEVSATLAPGGVGKTSLAVVEALAMATGWPLLGQEPTDQLRVWLWNGEEPVDELRRRIGAAMKHFDIPPDALGDRLFVTSGLDRPLVLAEDTRDGTQANVPLMHELTSELRRERIDVMLVDPFVSTHNVGENDNTAIQKAASAWKEVAVGANVAIGLAHHVRKLGGRDATTEDSRGADSLISKVRDGRVLNVMSEAEAARLGVLANDRFGYVWTGPGGKSNMSARTGKRAWFRLVGVDLGNGHQGGPGDAVAVVESWTPPHAGDDIEPEHLVKLGAVMSDRPWRAAAQATDRDDWIGAAVAEAFDLGRAEGWKGRAKALVVELERRGVICARSALGPKRRPMPVYVFKGAPEEAE